MIARAIATFFGVGYLTPAPGTWGTLAALPPAWLLAHAGTWPYLLGCALLLPLGLWATGRMTADLAVEDPGEIVVDEVLGMWIALLPVVWGAEQAGVAPAALWPGWIAAFLLFRLFDIWKPGPVGWADRRHGPWGVMLDDVIAGLLAALGVAATGWTAHVILL